MITNALDRLSFEMVSDLEGPDLEERNSYIERPSAVSEHSFLFEAWPLLKQVEVQSPPTWLTPGNQLRVVTWNMERCKYVEESAELIKSLNPDVCLVSEIDIGMARSYQRHTIKDLALELDYGYVYGIEFIETSLGDDRERVWHAGESNSRGLHGGAILSPHKLERPALLRLEQSGYWWQHRFKGEVRIGGRIAVLASLTVGGKAVTFVSVHFESHTDPAHRAEMMENMIDSIDAYDKDTPVIIGGDLNTCTTGFDLSRGAQKSAKEDLIAANPDRLSNPIPYEPLFEIAASRGYDWNSCNLMGATTTRTRPDGTPRPPHKKIDWFFTRGLTSFSPEIIPAVDKNGQAISDHELLLVTIEVE